jgi:hypothetical protein
MHMLSHRPSPFPIKMRIGGIERDPERYPLEDEALGRALLARVERVLENGTPRPTILAFSADQVWWYDLVPAIQMKADIQRLIAAVAGQDGIDCVGVVGVLNVRVARGRAFPGAVAFLEWPDGRWWSFMLPLVRNSAGQLSKVPAAELIERSAVEGWPRPGGLGGWWSRSRVEGLKLRVHRSGNEQVH